MKSLKLLALPLFNVIICSSIASAYDLNEAMNSTRCKNESIRALKQDLNKSRADLYKSIGATFLPDVSLNRYKERTNQKNTAEVVDSNIFNYTEESINFQQTIFNSGADLAGVMASKKALCAARESYSAQYQQILLTSITSYTNYIASQDMLQMYEKREELLREQYELNKVRFEYGDIPRTDLLQAEAAYSSAIAALETAKGNLMIAKSMVEKITYDCNIPEDIARIDHEKVEEFIPCTLEELMKMVQASPPIKFAFYQYEAAKLGVHVAASGTLPSIVATYQLYKFKQPPFPKSLKGNYSTVALKIPLLPNGGAGFFTINKAYYDKQKALAQYNASVQDTNASAIQLWNEYNSAEATRSAAYQSLIAGEKTLEGIREEAKFGARNIIEVLDVEDRYITSQTQYIQSVQNKINAAFSILSLVGRLDNVDYCEVNS